MEYDLQLRCRENRFEDNVFYATECVYLWSWILSFFWYKQCLTMALDSEKRLMVCRGAWGRNPWINFSAVLSTDVWYVMYVTILQRTAHHAPYQGMLPPRDVLFMNPPVLCFTRNSCKWGGRPNLCRQLIIYCGFSLNFPQVAKLVTSQSMKNRIKSLLYRLQNPKE